MAVPIHLKIVFRGDFVGTPEQWSFGLHFDPTQPAGVDAGQEDVNMDNVKAALTTYFAAGFTNGSVRALDTRVYKIGTDGRATGPIVRDDYGTSGNPVGTAAVLYPPQIALVISKVGADRGPGKNGRWYHPGPSMAMDGTQRLLAAGQSDILNAAVAFTKSISDAIDLPGGPAAAELLNISSRGGAGGTKQVVDHLEVGRVFDTMRSRRTSLDEAKTASGHIDW